MGEIEYIVSDDYDVAQIAIYFIGSFAEKYRGFTAKTTKEKKLQSSLSAIVK